ncbi:hypothetical protein [Allosalinactinospora lopnorensis]|uniref:hypothetical protein n=1 Tax=Allosalinactinospora lopnorensis TaxID=1352348 RepID=UPI00191C07E3|nr:hypothetical protein [Allosalinactinospora lopnorensis]
MTDLARQEHAALRNLVEQLIAATGDHLCWLGPVRRTAIEIRDRLDGGSSPVVEPVTANWQCPASGCRFAAIHPISHPCPL